MLVSVSVVTVCPVCGWGRLHGPPYKEWPGLPVSPVARPPYEDLFGGASYEVCVSCGFEFGFDDNPGTGDGVSFEQYRAEWIASGCRWWFTKRSPPPGWDGLEQLHRAGLG
jgi:hypothetical protein